jgi:hypothetical protein
MFLSVSNEGSPGFPPKACGNGDLESDPDCIARCLLILLAAFIDETRDHPIKSFRLFAVTEVARMVDDVHLRSWVTVGDDFKERVAAL